MTIEQKHKISKQIVHAIEKTEYYRNAIGKMKRHPNTFYEGTFEIRLVGTRSAIWGTISMSESISILKRKLKEAETDLKNLEKLIK